MCSASASMAPARAGSTLPTPGPRDRLCSAGQAAGAAPDPADHRHLERGCAGVGRCDRLRRHMGNGVGTMGMSFVEFMGMWTLMMTAMMLPAVAPVASLYLRTIGTDRPRRLLLFVGGYLTAWAAAGIPAYFALRIIDEHVADEPATHANRRGRCPRCCGHLPIDPTQSRLPPPLPVAARPTASLRQHHRTDEET